MEVKDIIKEGRPAEFKFEGEYTFAEIVSLATDNCYKTGVHDGYDYAIEETRKQMIDKACKWLKSNIENYYYRDEAFDQVISIKNLSSDFIKAMEE